MSQPLPNPIPKPRYSTGGIVALIVIGLLLLVPSGLCTAAIGIGAIYGMIVSPQNAGDALATIPMLLIVAGPFLVGGAAMLVTGIRRSRANRGG
jgi:hypothetical protein